MADRGDRLWRTLRDLRYFLYRRLSGAGILAARFQKDSAAIWLSDTFQVASFQDVFLDPKYWRAFTMLERAPRLIVDCGAHCGHFAILLDLCARARFGRCNARYLLVEPNAALHPALKRTIADAGIARANDDRARLCRRQRRDGRIGDPCQEPSRRPRRNGGRGASRSPISTLRC